MPKISFFKISDQSELLSVKKKLDAINADSEMTFQMKYDEIIVLIQSLGMGIKKEVLTLDCKIASWFLMSSLYVALSLLIASTNLTKANCALNEAISSLEQISKILSNSSEIKKLDLKFIIQCNTYDTADVESAIDIIQRRILPDLLHMSSEPDALFSVVSGSSLLNGPPSTPERPSKRLG